MARIKLDGLVQPFESIGKGIKSAPGAVLKGAASAATTGASAVGSQLTGVFSLGKGFRDFILRGTVVELAVAVVLGTAFTNLVAAITADLITPLLAAIFAGSNFAELQFTINSSSFKYGDLINAFLTFVFVVAVLYFCVVVPLQKLQIAAFKHKAIMRDCPYCLEEISMAATRCKHCTADVPLSEEMQRTMKLAEAALTAEEERRQQRWYRRLFAPCVRCCCAPQHAVVQQDVEGGAQLQPLPKASSPIILSPARHSMTGESQRAYSGAGGQPDSMYVSPQQSFSSSSAATAINIAELMQQEQPKDK